VWLRQPALLLRRIQKINGNSWTVPLASNPTCKARLVSRQVKGGLLTVCKIGQPCAFDGTIVPRDDDIVDPYWDSIDANPVKK
jgi:hypothetical protein